MASNITSTINHLNFNIATSPLYFVHSGHTTIKTDYYGLVQFGIIALDLTAYATSTNTLTFHIGVTNMFPEYYIPRSNYGLPIRCLAR